MKYRIRVAPRKMLGAYVVEADSGLDAAAKAREAYAKEFGYRSILELEYFCKDHLPHKLVNDEWVLVDE